METCTVETGLLKKKPCGQNMVTHCANCEQPLCKQHAVAQKVAGKFMCKQCDAAWRDIEKNKLPAVPAKKPAEAPKPSAATAPAATAAAAKAVAEEDAPLEFTPSKK